MEKKFLQIKRRKTKTNFNSEKFPEFLFSVFQKLNVQDEYIDYLVSNSDQYIEVFTHYSYDQKYNYEILEFIGDRLLNQLVLWYFGEKFPEILCKNGITILENLFKKYSANYFLSLVADVLEFQHYIRIYATLNLKILADVFEAFICATKILITQKYGMGIGYEVCYTMIKAILDSQDIQLNDRDVYTAYEKLRYIQDTQLRKQLRIIQKGNKNAQQTFIHYNNQLIGKGEGPLSNETASIDALSYLFDTNIVIEPQETYWNTCKNQKNILNYL